MVTHRFLELFPRMVGQAYSLRAHGCSISTLATGLVQYSVISADNLGLVIIWDTKTRRPRVKWQAHQETILTVKQISEKLVLTQLRDSLVKFWNVLESPPKEVFELPINSLNFCNVWYNEGYLFTPASVDSNKFDLYFIDEEMEFSRILAAICPHSLYMGQDDVPIDIQRIDDSAETDPTGSRNDFGIIMRMFYVPETCNLFLGFESGHVMGVHVDLHQKSAAVFYCESVHSPNPVMSLGYVENCLISGSTNNKIFVHDIQASSQHTRRIRLGHSGIQTLLIDPVTTNFLTLGFWDGSIQQIDWKESSPEPRFLLQRQVPRVDVTSTNTTSVNAQESSSLKEAIKLTAMTYLNPQSPKCETSTKKSYRDIIKSKAMNVVPMLFAGYEDGTIIAYTA